MKQSMGYVISQRTRKRVEQIFGWVKTVGRWARTRFPGQQRIEMEALWTGAAYNLLRMSRLRPAAWRRPAARPANNTVTGVNESVTNHPKAGPPRPRGHCQPHPTIL